MLQHTSKKIRRTTVCVATALAISLPGIATAKIPMPWEPAAEGTKAVVGVVKGAAKGVSTTGKVPGAELIDLVEQLNIKEQLQDTIALMQQMNADYEYFAGGVTGCKSECKAFRQALKDTFDDFLDLVDEVPVLSTKPGLFETVERTAGLIDVVPPRALYLMWQALDAQMDELRLTADRIRDLLDTLPPLDVASDIGAYAKKGARAANRLMCKWTNESKAPYFALVQAELERIGWLLNTVEGYIPDVEAEGELGVEAGFAVANVTGAASFSAQPTDAVKITLRILATITETINWEIRLAILRAEVVC